VVHANLADSLRRDSSEDRAMVQFLLKSGDDSQLFNRARVDQVELDVLVAPAFPGG